MYLYMHVLVHVFVLFAYPMQMLFKMILSKRLLVVTQCSRLVLATGSSTTHLHECVNHAKTAMAGKFRLV
jgi:hypothetical protein